MMRKETEEILLLAMNCNMETTGNLKLVLLKKKSVFFFNACLLSEQSLCAWSLLSKPLKLKSIVWIVHASSSIQRLGALLKSAIRVYSPIAWEDRMYLQRAIHGTAIVNLKRNV